MAKTLATVSPSDFVAHNRYAGADFELEHGVPFWDFDPGADDNGEPIGWCAEEPAFAPGIWERLALGGYQMPGKWRVSGSVSEDVDVQKPQGFDGAALISRGYMPGIVTMEGTLWTPEQWAIYQRIFPAVWTRPNRYSGQDVVLGKKSQVNQAQSATAAQQVAAYQAAGISLKAAQQRVTEDIAQQKLLGQSTQSSSSLIVGKEQALVIEHPACMQVGLSSVKITRVYLAEPGPIIGTMVVKFDAREYVPEPSMLPKTATKKVEGTSKRGPGAVEKATGAPPVSAPSGTHAALEPSVTMPTSLEG
jgi:hypothetical protein